MKNKIFSFLVIVLLSLMVLPVVNLSLSFQNDRAAWRKLLNFNSSDYTALYSVDFVLPVLGRIYYALGVSIEPKSVLIGKNGWMYLGDAYEGTITAKRVGVTSDVGHVIDKVSTSAASWDVWLRANGVNAYRILIGPDKDSIYPENIPSWAAHAETSAAKFLIHGSSAHLYADGFNALEVARNTYREPLYFKTDTHWNSLGAWVAFEALRESLSSIQPELNWPKSSLGRVAEVLKRPGGDLAGFQRIAGNINDSHVVLDFSKTNCCRVRQYDYKTGKLLASKGNTEIGKGPSGPLLVVSEGALNSKRVLWLRDSFGGAMSPYMAATFTDVLQVHYDVLAQEDLAKLVRKFKPDYVFVTVVERAALKRSFLRSAPFMTSKSRDDSTNPIYGIFDRVHDLVALDGNEQHQVTGVDPYFVFSFSRPIASNNVRQLVVDLNCANNQTSIPAQLFWGVKNVGFSEANSVKFTANQGVTAIDVSNIPRWTNSEEITSVRLDLVSPSGCPIVSVKSIELGVN